MEENSEDNRLEKDEEEFADDDQSPESRSTGTADYVKGTVLTCSQIRLHRE